MAKPQYNDQAWRQIRLEILARDHGICQIKGPKCRHYAHAVDHIVNVADGGARLDPANLRASCLSCNTAKRNAETAARARRARGDYTATSTYGDPKVRTTIFGHWESDGTWRPNSRDWGGGVLPGNIGDRSERHTPW